MTLLVGWAPSRLADFRTRLADSFAQAMFDEQGYRLAHPDVEHAIYQGVVRSGYQHYRDYGRGVGRSARTWLRLRAWTPKTFAVFRGADDYLSGIKIICVDRTAASYRLDVHRVGAKGVERVARVEFDRETVFDLGVGHIMWQPMPRAKGALFFIRLMQLDDRGEAAGLAEFRLSESDAQVFSSPTSKFATPPLIGFSPLTQCNLNCIHCISRPSRKKVREFSDDWWRQIEDLAASNQLYEIGGDYSGDILYAQGRPKAWLDRMIALGVGMQFTTHANNLSFELADKLIRSNLQMILFSIDSFDPEEYRRIRKGALPLDKVLRNITRFMRMRNNRRPSLKTRLSMVLMRRNLNALIPSIDFAAEHRIDAAGWAHLMVFTPDMLEESVLLDIKGYRAAYEAAMEHARKRGVAFWAPPPLTMFKPRKGHLPCPIPWNGVFLTGDGDVRACCMPESVVGNLGEQSLKQIWNGERMQAFRAAINTPDPPSPCGHCGIYRYQNNFETYVPGLSKVEREAFVARVLAQL
jgi:MoaA/NifB/PqqE/SkfB family radical SAM enzyme